MDNQKLFLELLNDVADIARTNDNSITTGEIDEYFSDIELTSVQMEYIYDYLCKSNITVKGYAHKPDENKSLSGAVSNDEDKDASSASSIHLKHYRKNVRELQTADEEELEIICAKILAGEADEMMNHKLIERHLVTVINIAAKYANRGVSSDELIEEGNLALVMGVRDMNGMNLKGYTEEAAVAGICEEYLRNRIRSAIIQYIDGYNEEESELCATIAKAGLVNEAVKKLAEEYGRIATIEELSDYTHIPVYEIQDIIRISGDSIEIGKG